MLPGNVTKACPFILPVISLYCIGSVPGRLNLWNIDIRSNSVTCADRFFKNSV